MQTINKRGLSLLLAFFLCLSLCVGSTIVGFADDFENNVYNIVTCFGDDAKTTRNFAWTTSPSYTSMVLRYAKKADDFNSAYIEKKASVVGSDYTNLLPETPVSEVYYKVDLTGLTPGTEYVYQIGSTDNNSFSQLYSFATEGEKEDSFSFIAITDPQGDTESSYKYLSYVARAAVNGNPKPKFFVSLGDQVNTANNRFQWMWFFDAMKEACTELPLMAVIGNHEISHNTDAAKEFNMHFNNPSNGGKTAIEGLTLGKNNLDMMRGIMDNITETIYSFDYGNVHIAVLNTGSDGYIEDCAKPLLNAQKVWLEQDLKNSNAKWKIVMLHQGPYPGRTDRYFGSRDILEPVFNKCGVDLVLQGHDHVVMRSYPMKNGMIATKENPDTVTKGIGTVYLIPGASADKRYANVPGPNYAKNLTCINDAFPTYSLLKVEENKLEVITKDYNGTIYDSFKIVDESYVEPVIYTVTVDTKGGTNIPPLSVPAGEKLPLPAAPIKAGFVFGGLYTDAACTKAYNTDSAVTANITLYAKWDEMADNPFGDVAENAWYNKAVTALAKGGLVNGVDATTFNPEGRLTYAQFCQILAKAKGLETGEANGYWAGKAILSCINAGYVLDRGLLIPSVYDVAIPREAAVSAMYLAKKDSFTQKVKNVTAADIPDSGEIAAEYLSTVVEAYNYGITGGVDEKFTFLPKNSLKRAEVCQLFYNLNWTKAE